MSHRRLYQSRMKIAFDKRVCPRKFSEGDLVLKKVSQVHPLLLTNMDDEELPLPVNSDIIKRYYA